MNLLSSLENEIRGSASKSSGFCGKPEGRASRENSPTSSSVISNQYYTQRPGLAQRTARVNPSKGGYKPGAGLLFQFSMSVIGTAEKCRD